MTEVTLKNAEATILKLREGESLLIRVDPQEFDENFMPEFAQALEGIMRAAGQNTARCLVISANTLELNIIKT